jgi:KUP system potassium uptake protein
MPTDNHGSQRRGTSTAVFSLGALGVVYGDIGTSPLYAMREAFEGAGHELAVTESNVLGVLSLIFWSLILVITIKYLLFVMRANNNGEGGIMALTSLIPGRDSGKRGRRILVLLGLFGTALLYGDGMITPAISVLSAVEGTEIASESLSEYVIPISVVILIGIFLVQKRGTASIGRVFGPVMVLWFSVLGLLGVVEIAKEPGVLRAVSPSYAIEFFSNNTTTGFFALGSVFLVVTGGEALYADMGHFGRRPIALGWFTLVLPGLLLNYFGQGALLIGEPESIDNPFYRLAPDWSLYPMVILATAATVIASQALISGAASLTVQATQLGYTPRMKVIQTSTLERGQVYVPAVNWTLMVACIGLVIGFRSSTNLAAAYGVAVTMDMIITTILFFVVAHEVFKWSLRRAGFLCGGFLIIDLAFFGANIPKVPAGGWFPLIVGGVVFTLLTTWHTGRRIVAARMRTGKTTIEQFIESVMAHPPDRAPGTAVYLYSVPGTAPPSLITNLRYNDALHEKIVLVSVRTEDEPEVHPVRRIERKELGHNFIQINLHYGFAETPDVPAALAQNHDVDPLEALYFIGRESIVVTDRPGMAMWRERLYSVMYRNSTSAGRYFNLPIDRTFEVGKQVEL